jgi:hypothetical protein
MILYSKADWLNNRDKDLADLYYYSLTFGNFDLAHKSLIEWKDRYGEINSLFYCQEPFNSHFQNSPVPDLFPHQILLVSSFILSGHKIKWGELSVSFFEQFKEAGLEPCMPNFYFKHAVESHNIELINYFNQYINLEEDNFIKSLSYLISKKDNYSLFHTVSILPNWEKQHWLFSLNSIIWSCLGNSPNLLNYFFVKHPTNIENLLNKALDFININPTNFLIHTRNGLIGDASFLKKQINQLLFYQKLHTQLPNKKQKNHVSKI